jgi:PleD family two-component response regulator
VTCSVGIASAKGPGCRKAHDSMIHRADQALHGAKQQGRDRVVSSP